MTTTVILLVVIAYSVAYLAFRTQRSWQYSIAGESYRLILFTAGLSHDDFDMLGMLFRPAMWVDSKVSGEMVSAGPTVFDF